MAGKYSTYGRQVMKRLVNNGMTIKQLADATGTTSQYMTKILHGRRSGDKYKTQIDSILKMQEVQRMKTKEKQGELMSIKRLYAWCASAVTSRQYVLSPLVRKSVKLLQNCRDIGALSCEEKRDVVSALTFYYAYEASQYYGILFFEEKEEGTVFTILTMGDLDSLLAIEEEDSEQCVSGMELKVKLQSEALKRAGLDDDTIKLEIDRWMRD